MVKLGVCVGLRFRAIKVSHAHSGRGGLGRQTIGIVVQLGSRREATIVLVIAVAGGVGQDNILHLTCGHLAQIPSGKDSIFEVCFGLLWADAVSGIRTELGMCLDEFLKQQEKGHLRLLSIQSHVLNAFAKVLLTEAAVDG